MLEEGFGAHRAELDAFARSIPPCAADQHALPVEDVLEKIWSAGDCVLVHGDLMFDPAPVPGCNTADNPSGTPCIATWTLAAPQPPSGPRVLRGARAIDSDAHTLVLYNDYRFDKPKRLCADDDKGAPRMPRGRLFRLPDAYRKRVRAKDRRRHAGDPGGDPGADPREGWAPASGGLDLSSICRVDHHGARCRSDVPFRTAAGGGRECAGRLPHQEASARAPALAT